MKTFVSQHKKILTVCLFCMLVISLLCATFLSASGFVTPSASALAEADDVAVLADETDNSEGVAAQSETASKVYSFVSDQGTNSFAVSSTNMGIDSVFLMLKDATTTAPYFQMSIAYWDFDANDVDSEVLELGIEGCSYKYSQTITGKSDGMMDTFKIYLSEFDLPSGSFSKKVTIYSAEKAGQEGASYLGKNGFVGTLTCVESQPLPVTPTKTGYTFTGWYTDEACTQLYTQDVITGDVTLYAGWRANNYTIKFDGNGKTSGTMSNLAMTYDTAANLTANAFKRTGYVFKGWATSASGTVAYTDEQSVKNLTTTDGGTVTLYAAWQQVSYTVHFNANGGEGTMNDQSHTVDIDKKLANCGFTKTGYTFKGWATSANGAVAYTNMQSVTNIGTAGSTVQLYAVWEVNKMTIKYNANGGTGSLANSTVNYNGSATLTLVGNSIKREYYTFAGWATSANGEVVYKDGDTISNTDESNQTINLYAVWEPIMCTVTFMLDGEIFTIVQVAAGTLTSDVIGQAVNTALYKADGTLPNV